MYCIGTIKQLKYGYFGIQAVFITPRPSLFPSAPPLEINRDGQIRFSAAIAMTSGTATMLIFMSDSLTVFQNAF